jgi:TonB family protein
MLSRAAAEGRRSIASLESSSMHMMRKILEASLLLMCSLLTILAQDNKVPFAKLDNQVKTQTGGWAGSKQDLSTVFNAERIRLGDNFEKELLKFLGNDIEKHYWISFFLEAPSYLHGNRPLPHLALLIKQQALSVLRGKTDQESLGDKVRLSVTAAVLSEDLGLHSLAESHKNDAEKILESSSEFRLWFPGMTDYDRCLYNLIGTHRKIACKEVDATNKPVSKCPIRGGFMDRSALSKPAPLYPDAARTQSASGVVTVEILIDEEGKVESVQGVRGHPLLQEAAVNAALQARFPPTRLSGKPVRVCGVLTYKFVPKE